MTTVVEFRARRRQADAVRSGAPGAVFPAQPAADTAFAGAEIILMPLIWLGQIGQGRPRKPLKRRFALRGPAPATV
jgi:hypothetical protein